MAVKVLLKELREERSLSQNQLAFKTGMSPQNIQKIEQGLAKSITFDTLNRFCAALDCQPGDLLLYTPEEPSSDNGDSASASDSKVQPLRHSGKSRSRNAEAVA